MECGQKINQLIILVSAGRLYWIRNWVVGLTCKTRKTVGVMIYKIDHNIQSTKKINKTV